MIKNQNWHMINWAKGSLTRWIFISDGFKLYLTLLNLNGTELQMDIPECFNYNLLLVWPEMGIKLFFDSLPNTLYVSHKIFLN